MVFREINLWLYVKHLKQCLALKKDQVLSSNYPLFVRPSTDLWSYGSLSPHSQEKKSCLVKHPALVDSSYHAIQNTALQTLEGEFDPTCQLTSQQAIASRVLAGKTRASSVPDKDLYYSPAKGIPTLVPPQWDPTGPCTGQGLHDTRGTPNRS